MVSNQVLSRPFEVFDDTNHHLIPSCICVYDRSNIEQILRDQNDNDQIENFIKLTKRRIQPKANLAGLWGVPTRFT